MDRTFSLTAAIRGKLAEANSPVASKTRNFDAECARALDSLAIPGEFLAPELLASESIRILGTGGAIRRSGATIYNMPTANKLDVAVETVPPNAECLEENDQSTPSDPTYEQVNFSLHEIRALVEVNRRLLETAQPSADIRLAQLLNTAIGRLEDGLITGSVSDDRFNPLFVDEDFSPLDCAGSTLAYDDILNLIAAASDSEINGNLALFMTPSVYFRQVLKLKDSALRPIFGSSDSIASQSDGYAAAAGTGSGNPPHLLGLPVWLTPRIPNDLGGSPANKSAIICTDPANFRIGDAAGIRIDLGFGQQFARNVVQIRATRYFDFSITPVEGVAALLVPQS